MDIVQQQIFPGFKNPVIDSQIVFRDLLVSMSEPGLISRVEGMHYHPDALYPATYAIALSLFDQDTAIKLAPVLQHPDIMSSLQFHSGIQLENDYADADFVICNENDRPDLAHLKPGTDAYPDDSCTLIIQCDSFNKGIIYEASGPGIQSKRKVRSSALNGTLIHQRNQLANQFPLGVDLIITCHDEFICIPRTTQLVLEQQ